MYLVIKIWRKNLNEDMEKKFALELDRDFALNKKNVHERIVQAMVKL